MKFINLFFSMLFTIIIAIFVISSYVSKNTGDFFLFVQFENTSLALPFVAFSGIGLMAGVFYTLYIQSIFKKNKHLIQDEEDETPAIEKKKKNEKDDDEEEEKEEED